MWKEKGWWWWWWSINQSLEQTKKKRKFIHHFQWKKRKRKFNQLQVLNVMLLLLLLKLKFFKNKKKPGTKIKPEITRTQKNQFFSFRLLAWVVKLDKNSFVFLSLFLCLIFCISSILFLCLNKNWSWILAVVISGFPDSFAKQKRKKQNEQPGIH